MTMSKTNKARYQRARRAAQGAITRDYDAASDVYALQPAQLANLELRRAEIRKAASARLRTIQRLRREGRTVADIVLITGISRAAVYRHIGKRTDDPLLW